MTLLFVLFIYYKITLVFQTVMFLTVYLLNTSLTKKNVLSVKNKNI